MEVRPRSSLVRVALGCVAFVGACSEPICGCSPPMPPAAAFIEGTVVDSMSAPVPGARVSTTGLLSEGCSGWSVPMASEPRTATTDNGGHFEMILSARMYAGDHCVDFVVRGPEASTADTSRVGPIVFGPDWEGLDTTRIRMVVGGP